MDAAHAAHRALALTLLWIGTGVSMFGGLLTVIPSSYADLGAAAVASGFLFGALATIVSRTIPTAPTIPILDPEAIAQRQRYVKALRITALLLTLSLVLATALWLGLMFLRVGFFKAPLSPELALRTGLLAAVVLAILESYSHHLSLVVPYESRPTRGQAFGTAVWVGLAAAGALVGFYYALAPFPLGPLLGGGLEDAGLLLLPTSIALGIALFSARDFPGPLRLAETRERNEPVRSRPVYAAALAAFAFLFLFLLLALVAGVGAFGVRTGEFQEPLFLGLFAALLLLIIVLLTASVRASRVGRRALPYTPPPNPEVRTRFIISLASAVPSVALLLLSANLLAGHAAFGIPPGRAVDVFALALMAAIGPYGFYVSALALRRHRLEERFPDFLRDIAASYRGGLTLPAAVGVAAKGDYGDLTGEVQKMADQLGLNVPFTEVLRRFAERVETPLIGRTVGLVEEASRSGGNTTDVLMSAARDAREIQHLRTERRSTMTLYTAVIYLAFLIFLGIAAVLYYSVLPAVIAAEGAVSFSAGGAAPKSGYGLTAYRTFYFMAALVQGVGNGFVAGMLERGRWITGLRHSFTMAAVTFVAFQFLV